MSKKQIFYLIGILSICLLFVLSFSSSCRAEPDEDPDDFDDCHERGDYRISSKTETELLVSRNQEFYIDIH